MKRVEALTKGDQWECTETGHTLETARLVIRPFVETDEEAYVASIDDEIRERNGWPDDPDFHRTLFRESLPPLKDRPYQEHWAIVHRDTQRLIGARSLSFSTTDYATATTGNWIAAEWRRRGYATEELAAFLDLFRRHLGICTVVVGTEVTNAATLALYEKFFFHPFQEGPVELNEEKTIDGKWLFNSLNATESCFRRPNRPIGKKWSRRQWFANAISAAVIAGVSALVGFLYGVPILGVIGPLWALLTFYQQARAQRQAG